MTNNPPEILAPVGDADKLRVALEYGADAVYLGGADLSLRAKSGGFSFEELPGALRLARERGARVYYCLNALPREPDMARVREVLEHLAGLGPDGPDALIIADPGVFRLARNIAPGLEVHLSTQANTANAEAVAFWRGLGATRVNLARELDLYSIRALTRRFPDMEFEIFAHGAMCMAVSGHCLLSEHLGGRSANMGLCTHPCRYEYRPTALRLEEGTRPGQDTWELVQDEGFSRILASDDQCLVRFLPWFRKAGVAALKLEGRTKSEGYLAQVVDVYTTARADLEQGRFRIGLYLEELANASTRRLATGFFLPGGRRFVADPPDPAERRPILAKVLERVQDGCWRIAVKSRWRAGEDVRILAPGLERPLLAGKEYGLEDNEGNLLQAANSGLTAVLRADHPALAPGRFLRNG